MIIPPFLKKGDRLGIVAPARKVSEQEMEYAFRYISDSGFVPVAGKHLYGSNDQFSGTDSERAEDINTFLADKSIRAIIAARGGYGCMRIVDNIMWDLLKKDPKWICGYSDLTTFHNHLFRLGYCSLHSTMPINFQKHEEATRSLFHLLEGRPAKIESSVNTLNIPGKATGKLIGGNLSLLYALEGSVSFPELKGCILFIEDLDEYLYHVDRMIISLKRAGALTHLSGLVIGGMTDMKDNTIPFGRTAGQIIYDAVKEYDYPVCFDFPAGHIDRNLAMMFGADITLHVNAFGAEMMFRISA